MKTPENANELLRANSNLGRLKAAWEPRHWSQFIEEMLEFSLGLSKTHSPTLADIQGLAEIFIDQLRTRATTDLEGYTAEDDLEVRDFIVWNIARLDLATQCLEGLPFIRDEEGDGEE